MTCPVCGRDTKVCETRTEDDCVRRRRVCLSCRYAFITIELDEDLFMRLKNDNNTQNRNTLFRTVANNN